MFWFIAQKLPTPFIIRLEAHSFTAGERVLDSCALHHYSTGKLNEITMFVAAWAHLWRFGRRKQCHLECDTANRREQTMMIHDDDPWSMIHDPWSMIHDPWSMIHDPWSMIHDPWWWWWWWWWWYRSLETWRNVERSKKLLLAPLDADAVLLHLKFNVFAETLSACVQTRDAYWHHAAKQSDCICRPASQQALVCMKIASVKSWC